QAARLFLTAPLSYPATLGLLRQAWVTLTDSGGIQEEAACLKLPVLVLRETTERMELIDSGGGMLVGTAQAAIVSAVRRLQDEPHTYQAMRAAPNPFGDGYAAGRIHAILFPE
ncbi:MAG: UDP-N-acetylglucosamine 2-epimerase, partial [Telluria sp.]|nr:UDP-N-acetylglucosamine 2-epimerase [Telluria sp.]